MPYSEEYPRLAYVVVRDANHRDYYAEIWERPSGKEMHTTASAETWDAARDLALKWIEDNHARVAASAGS